MKKLVLIDGKSVFYRGYYAMGALARTDGTPTGGVYGFAAIAMEIVRRLKPTKIVVAWDSATSVAKRRAIYPEYKAGRVKPGEDFYAQIPLLQELINDLGWSFVELAEYEADDIIGTLARQADEVIRPDGECDYETSIISSDLDMLQIVDENTRMLRILKGFTNIEEIKVPEIEAKYGIKKSQFLDLKSLKGDTSDNIPGVPGIGEKTAVKLLNEYQTLDGIYRNIDKISGAMQKKLIEGKALAYMSRELAQINFQAPISLAEIPDFVFDKEKVINGLMKLEFKSLVRKIENEDVADVQATIIFSQVQNDDLKKSHDEESAENDDLKETRDDGVEAEFLSNQVHYEEPEIISWDVKSLMHADDKVAKKILAGAEFWDLGQAEFLLNPLEKKTLNLFDNDVSAKYQDERNRLVRLPRLYEILTKLDLPLIPILFKMEKKGMLIDRGYFGKLKNEYSQEVKRLEEEIWRLSGKTFNINSPLQLSDILFITLQLPRQGIKKTTRGYSTGAKELEKLHGTHPIIEKIIEYREKSKLLSTYIVPMPDLADASGRIHTTFTQNVTATGRLSSKEPNLQNIPVRTAEGKRIRGGFVSAPGKVFVSADYSQFELRLSAVLAEDEALKADFNAGIDIHTKTASEAFRVPFNAVTKEQRRAAKVINFGILYGMSVKGLSDAAKMPFMEAKKFIENYFELRAPIKKYLDKILKQAREDGYVETYYGRRRPTPDVKAANFAVRSAAERAAQNMPIQGTEADLMKRAMIAVDEKLPEGAELVMQVHDSLIVECDETQRGVVARILQESMENIAPELPIKLAVEVTSGGNWGEL